MVEWLKQDTLFRTHLKVRENIKTIILKKYTFVWFEMKQKIKKKTRIGKSRAEVRKDQGMLSYFDTNFVSNLLIKPCHKKCIALINPVCVLYVMTINPSDT